MNKLKSIDTAKHGGLRMLRRAASSALTLLLVACASSSDPAAVLHQQVTDLQKQGRHAETTDRKIAFYRDREALLEQYLLEGYRKLAQRHYDLAASYFQAVLAIAPDNAEAGKGLAAVKAGRDADALAQQATQLLAQGDNDGALTAAKKALRLNPADVDAKAVVDQVLTARPAPGAVAAKMSEALSQPVSLELKDVSIADALDLLSQSSGISFILDKDVHGEAKTTIFVRNTAVQDILKLIFKTSQLEGKALNANTYLVYPSTADKHKQYDDLVVKSYFLDGQNPKKVLDVIQTLVSPKLIYLDEKAGQIIVRDTPNVISVIDRLVQAADLPVPEVVLDVRVLELSSDKSYNLGLQFPSSVSASLGKIATTTPSGTTGYNISDLRHLNSDSWLIGLPDPLLVANLQDQDGGADILANPSIRVKNKETAKVMVGDKVPVITSTVNQTSSAVTESVSYLDVGLKLEVTPEVHPVGDVSISLNLEVSNIVKEIQSANGLLTYQIGTRNTVTSMRCHDGETQMLAGLIQKQKQVSTNHLPLLGDIPLLGRLFSDTSGSDTKTEIVLLITPHIVRTQDVPPGYSSEFTSGSLDKASTEGFTLGETGHIQFGGNSDGNHTHEAQASAPTPVKLVDMDTATAALQALVPPEIGKGQDYVVTLAATSRPLNKLVVDYSFDANVTEIVGVNPIDPEVSYDMQALEHGARITFTGNIRGQGPLAVMSMRARSDTAVPITLKLAVPEAIGSDSKPVAVQPADAVIQQK